MGHRKRNIFVPKRVISWRCQCKTKAQSKSTRTTHWAECKLQTWALDLSMALSNLEPQPASRRPSIPKQTYTFFFRFYLLPWFALQQKRRHQTEAKRKSDEEEEEEEEGEDAEGCSKEVLFSVLVSMESQPRRLSLHLSEPHRPSLFFRGTRIRFPLRPVLAPTRIPTPLQRLWFSPVFLIFIDLWPPDWTENDSFCFVDLFSGFDSLAFRFFSAWYITVYSLKCMLCLFSMHLVMRETEIFIESNYWWWLICVNRWLVLGWCWDSKFRLSEAFRLLIVIEY